MFDHHGAVPAGGGAVLLAFLRERFSSVSVTICLTNGIALDLPDSATWSSRSSGWLRRLEVTRSAAISAEGLTTGRIRSSTRIVGNSATLIADVLTGGEELIAITLEFGTLPGIEVLEALRADNWLCLRAGVTPEPGAGVTPELRAAIKRQLRDAFYPPEAEWRETVLARGREVFAQAFAALAGHLVGFREPERA